MLVAVDRHTEAECPGGPVIVVSIIGSLDQDTCHLVEAVLNNAIDAGGPVRCDLTGTDFLAAAGVAVLLAAHHRAQRRGHRVSVRGAHGITRRVLLITGTDEVLTFED
jgi:anti-anti-sigma factor